MRAAAVAPNLQRALDDWAHAEAGLRDLSDRLERGDVRGEVLDEATLLAPLPRAYEWIDGSAYLNHVRLVRRARGAAPPDDLETSPLIYQGGSGRLLGAREPLGCPDVSVGLDFEGEIACIVDDVALGTSPDGAARRVRLFMLANDVTYREWAPRELQKGFGFFVSKPPTAFSPFAVTPDELGNALRGARVFLRLVCTYNGACVGDLETGDEMHFSFADLVARAATSRGLAAGTIVGSGTVSNRDAARGVACLVERRTREALSHGAPSTPYMKPGDVIRIEAFDGEGTGQRSVFGAIEQRVVAERRG